MRKLILFVMWCVPAVLSAQESNGVILSGFSVDAGTVTFNVHWNKAAMPQLWSDTVWVFVDYNENGARKRLPLIAGGATLTTHTALPGVGRVMEMPGNDKGVWVAGNARTQGRFSATVKLLTAVTDLADECVYASNYPPVGKYISAGSISFTGTPQYDIAVKRDGDGATDTLKSDDSFTVPDGYTVQSFTDETGAPGIFTPATYTLSGADVCSGEEVTLTLSGSQRGWRYQLYRDAAAVGTAVDGTGSAITFNDTPGTTGNFDYTVRTENNPVVAAQCAMQASNVHGITVNPLPTVSSVTSSTVCYGQPATLTAVLGAGTAAPMTCTWNLGGTTYTSATVDFTTAPLTEATTYTLQLTDANGCVSAVSAIGTITVYSAFSAGTIASDGQTICPGASVNTIGNSADASGGDSNIVYEWQHNGTAIASANSASYTPAEYSTAVGAHTFTRWAKDNTCNSWTQSTGSWVLTVHPQPTVSSVTSSTVCYGQPATLTVVLGAGTTTSMTYTWKAGTAAETTTTSGASGSYVLVAIESTTYSVKATNAAGCTGAVATGVITVNPLPAVPSLSAPASVCAGNSLTFTATNGSGSYDWAGMVTGAGNNKTAGTAAGNYVAKVRSSQTYTGITCYSAYTGEVTGVINALPSATSLTASAAAICNGESVTLTASGSSAASYSINGGAYTTATTYSVAPTANTTYTLKVKNTEGCESSNSATRAITVHTAVDAASISGASSNTCPLETLTLTASATGATIFTWFKDGSSVTAGTGNTYPVTSTGSYTVQGKNANCTGSTSTQKVVTISLCCTNCATFTACQSTGSAYDDDPDYNAYYYYISHGWRRQDGSRYGFTQISNVSYESNGTTNWEIANSICSNKGPGWRLPTLNELYCMYINRSILPGGNDSWYYWSASEYNEYFLYAVKFNEGWVGTEDEFRSDYVKCVK